jgi:hypothetical protein
MSLENRTWIVLSSGSVDNINFDQVMETSKDTLRYSLDGTMTFVKYDTTPPDIASEALSINGTSSFNHTEILELLSTSEWTNTSSMI